MVANRLDRRSVLVEISMPAGDGRLDAAIRKLCRPLEERYDELDGVRTLRVMLTDGALGNLRRGAGPAVRFEVLGAARESLAP
jgi:hypothetical protein